MGLSDTNLIPFFFKTVLCGQNIVSVADRLKPINQMHIELV